MNLKDLPIQQRVEWLLNEAQVYCERFSHPDLSAARRRYVQEHPSPILVTACIDGRVNLAHAMQSPPGLMKFLRNIGPQLTMRRMDFASHVDSHISAAAALGQGSLIMVTYHFSGSHTHLGCAAYGCDTELARQDCFQVAEHIRQTYVSHAFPVYPLVCGFDTDTEALIIHGADGRSLALSDPELDADGISLGLHELHPHLPENLAQDFLPLLEGNANHAAELRATERGIALEHCEWAICVGNGFEFIRTPNVAMVIGPYSPDMGKPVSTAARVVARNMQKGRIPDDGALLLSCCLYNDGLVEKATAEFRSRLSADLAENIIAHAEPELTRRLTRLSAIFNIEKRSLELLHP